MSLGFILNVMRSQSVMREDSSILYLKSTALLCEELAKGAEIWSGET